MDVSSMPNEQPESNPEGPPSPSENPQPSPETTPEPSPESSPEPSPEPSQPSPEPQAQPEPQSTYGETATRPRFGGKLPGLPNLSEIPRSRLIAAGALVIVLIALALVISNALKSSSTTTTVTTTVQQSNLSQIAACTTISKSGTYYLASDINDSSAGGPCITITASNVRLDGNGHSVTGNGPYTDVPPFSYGIQLSGVSNVTISDLLISRFSYDVYLNGTTASTVTGSNLTSATLAGVYLFNSFNNTIELSTISRSQSVQGGIYMRSGTGNRFINNTVSNNAYYGLVVNSTQNTFSQIKFGGNSADIVCNKTSAPRYSNSFSASQCTVNDYCGFASCKTNVPFNVSSIRLAPGPVSTCGSIYSPGNYTLSRSVSTATYLNTSNPLAKGVSCIQIFAPHVNFDCANRQINNSGYGIYIGPSTNVSISNCVLYNNNYGLLSGSAFNPRISNTIAINNTYGIFLSNTTGGKVSNARLIGNNTFGLFINSSSGLLLNNIRAQNNSYGVYVSSGESDVFSGGVANNNTKADVYCTPATYNSTTNLAQSFSCGLTDCTWASSSCKQTVPPTLSVYPLSGCKTITAPGNYTLNQNIITSSSTCFNIQSNNVALNCKSHSITGGFFGSAFILANRRNVSISNCGVSKFNTAVNVTNTTLLSISRFTINNTNLGVKLSHASASTISSTRVRGQSLQAFNFSYVNTSIISYNLAMNGNTTGSGYSFANSDRNNIFFNNATSNPSYGFSFYNSENNTVYNNSAFSNVGKDYVCSGTSAGLYSNPISVDDGLSKSQCRWIVALSPLLTGPSCQAIFAPSIVSFTRDLLYTSASTCFSIYTTTGANATSANNTEINCNGHTAYAPNGGTFASIFRSANVKVDNCLLWNFSTGVQSNGLSTVVYNNTFAAGGNAVVLNGGRFSSIYRNTVDNNTNGMIIGNVSQTNVYNNNFFNNTLSIAFYNSTFSSITNNTALNSGIGIFLSGTDSTTLHSNLLVNSSISAIKCAGSSINASSKNADYGGNVCQKGNTTTNCQWIKSSTSCV
ncbi:MAG: right-handed parallel beta-helix repeat-containing protein [Candidatus Micrarchaeota archaeon]|nr:right-handed parallel beta-helix repeat-containing protein [Candidatus Micrarchaeota archaeon]